MPSVMFSSASTLPNWTRVWTNAADSDESTSLWGALDSTRVASGFGRRSRCGAGASDRVAVTAGWDVREVLGLDFPDERLREIRCRKLVSHDGMNLSGSGSPSELVDETVEDVTTFDSANWIAQGGWPGRVLS